MGQKLLLSPSLKVEGGKASSQHLAETGNKMLKRALGGEEGVLEPFRIKPLWGVRRGCWSVLVVLEDVDVRDDIERKRMCKDLVVSNCPLPARHLRGVRGRRGRGRGEGRGHGSEPPKNKKFIAIWNAQTTFLDAQQTFLDVQQSFLDV